MRLGVRGRASAKRHRGGKTVTLVCGLALNADALAALGRRLRTARGRAVKDRVLEVHGDHAERVITVLRAEGCMVKRAGG